MLCSMLDGVNKKLFKTVFYSGFPRDKLWYPWRYIKRSQVFICALGI